MNDNDFYKNFDYSSKNKFQIGNNIFIPFLSGVLGSLLVLGITFGIPTIRNKLITSSSPSNISSVATSSDTNTGLIDTVSLNKFSDTAAYASSKVLPSIVGINVEYSITSSNMFFSQTQSVAEAQGSGIIVSDDGYILTNNHIINSSDSSNYYQMSEATKIEVYLYGDETPYEATVVGADTQTDLAIIKIDKSGLIKAELGDSSTLKIGESVLAVGNPLGVGTSVSSGIVSAVNRKVTTDGVTYNLIQTDAAINSGNSGGALVNNKGQVIGINTLKVAGDGIEGMGFAIPINDTIDIYQQLIKNGKVLRPFIGISGIDLDERTAKKNDLPVGIYVKEIETFSSAEKAGIKIGDVITSIDGTKISTMQELNNIKNTKKIGDTVILEIYRADEEIEISLKLGEAR